MDPNPRECRTCGYDEANHRREAHLYDPRRRWADLFGADPDYCEGKPVEQWLDEQRGDA